MLYCCTEHNLTLLSWRLKHCASPVMYPKAEAGMRIALWLAWKSETWFDRVQMRAWVVCMSWFGKAALILLTFQRVINI